MPKQTSTTTYRPCQDSVNRICDRLLACEIADNLINLRRAWAATWSDDGAGASQARNVLAQQKNAILDWCYNDCGIIKLRDIIRELAAREAFGILQDRKWLWQEAVEVSPEARAFRDQCYAEQLRACAVELPRFV